MKYGFIGIGTLAEAIIDGLIGTKLSVDSVIVSPRNAQVSARLAARHGVVTIASHNQAVVDNSDMVFIAVRPQVVESVLTSLKFPKGQHVVSLVAATSTQKLRSWVGSDTILTQAIPLPFVSARQGVTAVHPPTPEVCTVFAALGSCAPIETEEELEVAGVASALMGPFLGCWSSSRNGLNSREWNQWWHILILHTCTRTLPALQRDRRNRLSATYAGSTPPTAESMNFFDTFQRLGGGSALIGALEEVHARIRQSQS